MVCSGNMAVVFVVNQIKEDVKLIVKDELERISNDENLKHLIQK